MKLWWFRLLGAVLIVLLGSFIFGRPGAAENVDVTIGVGDTTVLIRGDTSPNAAVTFIDGNSVIGSTVADAAGSYSQQFTGQTPGIHTFKVFAQDDSGRFTDTVSVVVNLQEHFQTEVMVFLPPTIQLAQVSVRQGDPLTISGATAPNATVLVYVGSASGTTTADSDGNWRFDIQTATLTPGQHQFYVVASKSGQQSYSSQPRNFTVTAVSQEGPSAPVPPPAPSQPKPGQPARIPAVPIILWPQPGQVIDHTPIEVTGTAEPGVLVELWNRGQLVGSAFVGKDGRWRITITPTDYANNLQARACRQRVCGDFSASVQFFWQLKAGLLLSLDRYGHRVEVDEPVFFKAQIKGGDVPYQITVDWGDGKSDTYLLSQTELSFTHRFRRAGQYNGKVTVVDSQNRQAVANFAVEVHRGPSGWPWWVYLLLFLLGLLIVVMLWWIARKIIKDRRQSRG